MTTQSRPADPQAPNNIGEEFDRARIWAVGVLVSLGWLAVAAFAAYEVWHSPSVPLKDSLADLNDKLPGISPAVGACYAAGSKTTGVIIGVAIGLALGVAYVFGTFLYKKFRETSSQERGLFWEAVQAKMREADGPDLRDMISEFREYEKLILDRRNIYWSLFARFALAILVVGLIALLISSCRVESQAGLPIISGIIAFIIGQGSELVHAASSPVVISPPRRSDAGSGARPRSETAPTAGGEAGPR